MPVIQSILEITNRSLAVDDTGRIIVGQTSGSAISPSIRVVRLLADGSFDPAIGSDNPFTTPGLSGPHPSSLIQLPDGRFLGAGGNSFPQDDVTSPVYRYSEDFRRDLTWGTEGMTTASELILIPRSGHILLPQPDGRILTVGNRTELSGTTSLRLIRLQAEPGVIFSPRGTLTTTESGTTATFEVRLSSKPTANVMIPVTSSDPTEGTVSVSSLTFTPTTGPLHKP